MMTRSKAHECNACQQPADLSWKLSPSWLTSIIPEYAVSCYWRKLNHGLSQLRTYHATRLYARQSVPAGTIVA